MTLLKAALKVMLDRTRNVGWINTRNSLYLFIGNLIGAGVAFISEAIFHSVRLVIYFVIDENKRQEFIDKGYAVTPEKYIKRITELGGACLAGGGLAALATLGAGALFGITGGAALTAISILFGVIGYLVGRALTKMVSDRVKTYLYVHTLEL